MGKVRKPRLEVFPRPEGMPGIESLVWVKAASLTDHPQNWKTHPSKQLNALRDGIRRNGWAGALLYNLTTNRLIDGHARKGLDPEAIVPVITGRWTVDQERSLVLTLDPLGELARADNIKLAALIEEEDQRIGKLVDETNEATEAMLNDLRDESQDKPSRKRTFSVMEVSSRTYAEIEGKLDRAGRKKERSSKDGGLNLDKVTLIRSK
jgi:hypothetical protein